MKNQPDHRNSRKRLPRLERVAESANVPLRMMPRDIEIIRAVYNYRVLTSEQLERLFFLQPGKERPSNTRCSTRLQALFHHGFLARDEQPQKVTEGRKPLLYFLDRRGAEYLSQLDEVDPAELDWRPSHNQVSPLFLDHLLKTNDVRIDIELACRMHDAFELSGWVDDRSLKRQEMREYVLIAGARGQQRRVAVIPDGFFLIRDATSRFPTLLEIDMGTESSRTIRQKVAAYKEFERTGRYRAKFDAGGAAMRVLFVTTGAVRMQNIKAAAEQSRGKYNFWFTTFDQVAAETFLHTPIWHVPGYDTPMPFIVD